MQNSKFIRIILFLFGAIALGIGSALLFFPVAFEALADIDLYQNSSLLSEIRAFGGMLFSGGIMILLGVFIPSLLLLSFGFSGVFYLSIGLARVLSRLIDGIPAQSLVTATIAEWIIGGASLLIFYKLYTSQKKEA